MKGLSFLSVSTAVLLSPAFALAQGLADGSTGGDLGVLIRNILTFSNTVLIPFIIGIGFLVFVWGMFQYFIVGGASDEGKEKGKDLMIYATLGFLLIIVFWGVVNLLADTTGLEGESFDVDDIEVITID